MNRNKIVKDTIFLTAVDFAMQGLALMLNVIYNQKARISGVGTNLADGYPFLLTAINFKR